ncbi:MAG TPA: flavoprotein, partial [Psychromonas sp.]
MSKDVFFKDKITLAVTGASGSGYFLRLLQALVDTDTQIYLLLSDAAKIVLRTEENEDWPEDVTQLNVFLQDKYQSQARQIVVLAAKDW